MRRLSPMASLCLITAIASLTAPPASLAADQTTRGTARSWGATQRSAANLMIAKLDMTSFPNSIGPRREPGKKTLADYGFVDRSSFDDGWAYAKMADGSWEFGVFVLTDGRRAKRLCVTDTAVGGGTYRSTIALDVARQPDGSWRSTKLLSGVYGCS